MSRRGQIVKQRRSERPRCDRCARPERLRTHDSPALGRVRLCAGCEGVARRRGWLPETARDDRAVEERSAS